MKGYKQSNLESICMKAGHLVLAGKQLRTAGEIAGVAGDPPPR